MFIKLKINIFAWNVWSPFVNSIKRNISLLMSYSMYMQECYMCMALKARVEFFFQKLVESVFLSW